MEDRALRKEILTLLLTGFETLGDALGWAWYLLARDPEVAATLESELAEVLNGRPPQLADVGALRYTEMVFAETLRFYPTTWLYVRTATKRETLPSGVTIPASAKLYLCPYVIHRHPRYFENPERFDPNRFRAGSSSDSQFAYFPFGRRPHTCLGEALAKLEAVMILASVAQQYRFRMMPQRPVVPVPAMTLHANDGIGVRVESRQ